MSFTNDVKSELSGIDVSSVLKDAFTYGLLYGFRNNEPIYATSSSTVIECMKTMFPSKCSEIEIINSGKKKSWLLNINNDDFLGKYSFFDNNINKSFVSGNDIVTGVFLRGVFMSCGNVYVQKAGYHLELSPSNSEKCRNLFNMINEQGMKIDISERRKLSFLYSKDSENISDFLTFIGAMQSAMEIMNIKILKGVRSNINRAVNCETANIGKTAAASAKQLMDIRFIAEQTGLDKLDDDLRDIAKVRLDNPDMPLSGLGKLLDPQLSRSGVNHRLLRIAKIAEELRKGQEN